MDSMNDQQRELVIPYHILYQHLYDDEDTEQHKARRGQNLHKRSIRNYRHATGKWGAALESFSPFWFVICISSGGLGLILNSPFPYHARWLEILSSILFVVDLLLFLLFMGIMLARWVVYPHVAVRRAWSDPDELGAYAIPPIALLTIAALTTSQVSESWWGGHSFTLVAYVLWWIAVPWIFATAVTVFTVLFYTGNQEDRVMSPILFMAPVGLATAGTEGGFITIYGHALSSRLAGPQLVVSYFAIGLAMFMALALYTIYTHKLLSSGWPIAAKRAGIFVLIGPCGQLSTALQLLGESASAYRRLAQYKPESVQPPDIGTFWRAETASGLDGAGILLALLLLGFGYFWFAIAVTGLLDVVIRKQATYGLIWWSLVFPTVTLTTAWLELANSMDSPAFRALVSAMTVLIVIMYFGNWVFTIRGLLSGQLIRAKTQAEVEDELMRRAQDDLIARQKKEEV